MRQIPLYVLTAFVGLSLAYSFITPFQRDLEAATISSQDVSIAPEAFELPEEMTSGQTEDATGSEDAAGETQGRVESVPRQVDPDDAPVPMQPGPLQRVGPRQPLSEIGQAAPPAPPPAPVPVDNSAKPVLLYQPVATTSGTIEASGYKISLEGIEALAPEETCNADSGARWPCGMAARTALRSWLRSRAIECDVPGQPPAELIATQCKLGTTDVAGWLVSNGWARAQDGSPLADMMKKAEEGKRGIFGDPPAALPVTNDLALPPMGDASPLNGEPADGPAPLTAPDAPFPPKPQ